MARRITRPRAVVLALIAAATIASLEDAAALVRAHGFAVDDLETDLTERHRLAELVGIFPDDVFVSAGARLRFISFLRERHPELASSFGAEDFT